MSKLEVNRRWMRETQGEGRRKREDERGKKGRKKERTYDFCIPGYE